MNGNGTDMTQAKRRRSANVRTAVIFLSIALSFFVGIIATRLLPGPTTGIGVMGAAVLLFLLVAIGRHLRTGGRADGNTARGTFADARGGPPPDAAKASQTERSPRP